MMMIHDAKSERDSGLQRSAICPPLTNDSFGDRVRQFMEHDETLRQLATLVAAMLDQIQDACQSLLQVMEVYAIRARHGSLSPNMAQGIYDTISAQGEMLAQSLRFTFLDPVHATLEKHDHLKQKIAQYEQCQKEINTLAVNYSAQILQRFRRSNSADGKARAEEKKQSMHMMAVVLETEISSELEILINVESEKKYNDLFGVLRLQLASFFCHIHKAMFNGLTDTESEVVLQGRSTTRSALSPRSSDTADSEQTESSFLDEDSMADNEATTTDCRSEIVAIGTIEQFQRGQRLSSSSFDSASHSTSDGSRFREKYQAEAHPQRNSSNAVETGTMNSWSSGALGSIRRSFNENFSRPRRENATTSALTSDLKVDVDPLKSMTIQGLQPRLHSLVDKEWQGVEASLWELDCRDHLITTGCDDTINQLRPPDQDPDQQWRPELLASYAQFMGIDDIARLSKVSRSIHHSLLSSPSIWKRSIRLGVPPSLRSSIWLALIYGPTPWYSIKRPPHSLSKDKRKMVYERLLIQLASKCAEESFLQPEPDSEEEQLLSWLQEIDVDVARTCTRAMGIGDYVTASGKVSCEDGIRAPSVADIAILHDSTKADAEARIRRVLRAYVVYNPNIGYCQGMNFLVRLLAEVAEDEADVFWLFVGLSEPESNRNLYEPGLAVLQPLFARFESILAKVLPELLSHLKAEGVHVSAFAARWFLTFFSTYETIDPALVIRLLDNYVMDGWRTVFSMALVVLEGLQYRLIEADLEEIHRILQFPKKYLREFKNINQMTLYRHALAYSITNVLNEI